MVLRFLRDVVETEEQKNPWEDHEIDVKNRARTSARRAGEEHAKTSCFLKKGNFYSCFGVGGFFLLPVSTDP